MKVFKSSTSLYNYIGSVNKVLVFYRSDSEFCGKVVKKFESYLENNNASFTNMGIKFVYFFVNSTNAADVEVIKIPQFRYFVKGNEVSSFIGDIEFEELWDMLRS